MINVAEQGVQNTTAQLELLLTIAMMSRITLDLKKRGRSKGFIQHVPPRKLVMVTRNDIVFQLPLSHDTCASASSLYSIGAESMGDGGYTTDHRFNSALEFQVVVISSPTPNVQTEIVKYARRS